MGTLCAKCGNDNDLGKIFCTKCGVKLDLSAVTSEDLIAIATPSWFKRNAKWIAIGAGCFLLFMFCLGMWPKKPLATKTTRPNARAAEQKIASLHRNLKMGESISVKITQVEANGYLMWRKHSMGVTAATISFADNMFFVRVNDTLGPWKLGPIRMAPRYSYDLTGTFLDGRLYYGKAHVGHLRLFGPAKKGRIKALTALFEKNKDKDIFKKLSKVKFRSKEATLTVGKKR